MTDSDDSDVFHIDMLDEEHRAVQERKRIGMVGTIGLAAMVAATIANAPKISAPADDRDGALTKVPWPSRLKEFHDRAEEATDPAKRSYWRDRARKELRKFRY